jgi:hypothetical protein
MLRFGNFMLAIMSALVVGKAVLVANAMPFLCRFDTAPMIQPVLFKTIVYCVVVFLVRFLEQLVEYWLGGGRLQRDSRVCSGPLLLAQVCRYPDLDLRSIPNLHLGRGVEELNALFGGEPDPARCLCCNRLHSLPLIVAQTAWASILKILESSEEKRKIEVPPL